MRTHTHTQYLKLEDVNEQSRLHQWQINCRSSLLAVMLHHTVNHQTPTGSCESSEETVMPEPDLDVEGDGGKETGGIVSVTERDGNELIEVGDSEMKLD